MEGQDLEFRGPVSKRWHKARAAGEDWACLKLKGAARFGGRSSASVGRTWVAERGLEMGRGLQEEGRVSGDGEGHEYQGRVTKPGKAKGLEGYGSREKVWSQVGHGHPGLPGGNPRLLELLRQRSDVLHAVLVRRQVALRGLVAPQQRPHLLQRSRLVVPLAQHLLLPCSERERPGSGHRAAAATGAGGPSRAV